MIHLEELMIGNWVGLQEDPGDIILVECIGSESIQYSYEWFDEDSIYGIKLSRNVVEACEFKPYTRDYKYRIYSDYMCNIYIEWSSDDGIKIIHNGSYTQQYPHIQHLHQLQNLYFSLTGKRLKVNY